MSEWRSACVTAPYPPELLLNTPRRPGPPHPKRCSIVGSISCSRKSSQAPMAAGLMYWVAAEPGNAIGKGDDNGRHAVLPISELPVDEQPTRVRQGGAK